MTGYLRFVTALGSLLVYLDPGTALAQGLSASAVDVSAWQSGNEISSPRVATGASSTLAAWEEGGRIWIATITGGAPSVRLELTAGTNLQRNPAVAADGSTFLVAWSEETGGVWNVQAARVTVSGGSAVPGAPFPVAASAAAQDRPAVAARPGEFIVAWQQTALSGTDDDIFVAQVLPETIGVMTGMPPVFGHESRPSVAAMGSGYVVAWEEATTLDGSDVLAAFVDFAGVPPSGTLLVAGGSGDQVAPSVAASADRALITWGNSTGGTWDIAGHLVTAAAGALAKSGVVLGVVGNVSVPGGASPTQAAVANGHDFVVLNDSGGALSGTRVVDGLPRVTEALGIATVSPGLDVEYSGGRYLAVHRSGTPAQIAATVIDPNSELVLSCGGTGVGSVSGTEAGLACGTLRSVPLGTQVVLTAAASPGSSFTGWSGCPSALGTTCTATVTGRTAIGATFALDPPAVPGTPTLSAITSSGMTVTWTSSAGATSYDVDRATAAERAAGTWTTIGGAVSPLVETGLTADTVYWYRVRAVNAAGESGDSAESSARTLMNAPTSAPVVAVTAIDTASVALSWTAVADATSYEVARATYTGATLGAYAPLQASWAATTYSDAGLSANTRYAYRITPVSSGGAGPSGTTSAYTAPGTPTGLAAGAIAQTSLSFTWTAPAGGADSYVILRSTASGGTFTQVGNPTTTLSFTDTTVTADTAYWYVVRARNAEALAGADSSPLSIRTLAYAPAAAPVVTAGAASTSLIPLSWTAVSGATSYRVEQADDASNAPGTWALVNASATGTSLDRTGLSANTRYWFRVVAENSGGAGAASTPVARTTLPNAPAAPTVTATATSAALSWAAPAGGSATYDVERAPDVSGTAGAYLPVGSAGAATTYTATTLAASTRYWFRIVPKNGEGVAGAPSPGAAVTTFPAAPGAPTFSSVTDASLTVGWAAAAGASTYEVSRAADQGGTPDTGSWQVRSGSIAAPAASYAETGLTGNTAYWFRVRASGPAGFGEYSPAARVLTVPTTPPTFTATSPTSSTVTLTWTPATGGTGSYVVQRSATGTDPWIAVAGSPTNALTLTDSGLAAGTGYTYRVIARNATGDSPPRIATVTTRPAAPAAPTYGSITPSSVSVSWAAAAGAATYTLQRATGTGAFADVATGLTARTYSDTGLASNTTYRYRVSAANASGDGAYSTESSVLLLPVPPSAAPTFNPIGTSNVTVNWIASPGTGALTYEVSWAPNTATGPGNWTVVATGVTGTSFAHAGLPDGSTNWYRVVARNATGPSTAPSPQASVLLTPGAPGSLTLSNVTTSSVTLTWTAAVSAVTYRVERAPDVNGTAGTYVQIATGLTALTFLDTNLVGNTRYWYRVAGVNASGPGTFSATANTLLPPSAPRIPTPQFVSITQTTLTVNWAAPIGGAASYDLERAPDNGGVPGTFTRIATNTTALHYDDTGLTAATTYWYRIWANNASGTAASELGSVTTLTPPPMGAPSAPTYSYVTTTGVTVSWTAVTDATSYHLDRAPDANGAPGTWARARNLMVTTAVEVGLTPNTRYWYRAQAETNGGVGPLGPESSVVTLPNAPGALTFTNVGANTLTVNWTSPVGGAASYEVERATSASGPWLQISAGANALSYSDSGLAGNTTYYYRVRAANSDGRAGAYAATASVRTNADTAVALPVPPAAPTFTSVTTTSVRVNWTGGSGATTMSLERAPAATAQWAPLATIATTTVAYTSSGLTANTGYSYRICSTNSAGTVCSPASGVVTLPNAPGAPAFSAVAARSLTVSWTAPAGSAASYKVERASSSSGPWSQLAAGVPLTTYTDTTVVGNATFYYRVRATNSEARDGAYSLVASVVTPPDSSVALPVATGAPTFPTVSTNYVRVAWTAGSGATSMTLERAPASTGQWTTVASLATTALSYTSSGLSANTRYSYRLRSTNSAGASYSAASSVMTLPTAPSSVVFPVIAARSVTVSWAAPSSGAASYKLERAPSSTGPWTQLAGGIVPSYADTTVAGNTTYYYRVRATNAEGRDGPYSPVAAVATPLDSAVATAVPVSPPAYTSVATTSVRLSWTGGSGATTLAVERAPSAAGPWAVVASGLAPTTTAYTNSGLAANTPYTYRIRSTNSAGSSWSQPTSVITLPTAPSALAFPDVLPTTVTLSWAPPSSGASSYKVERSAAATGPWTQLAASVPTPMYVDRAAMGRTTYWYRVRATNGDGRDGAYSPSATVTTPVDGAVALPLPAGTPTYTSVATTSVRVNWTMSSGATSAALERAPAAVGPWTTVATVATSTVSYSSTGLTSNTPYWFRVRTANSAGIVYSQASRAVTLPLAPGAPTFAGVTARSITLAWTAPSTGAASYDVERATSASGPWAQVGSSLATAFTDAAVVGNSVYYYRVRATNDAGLDGAYSAIATISTPPDADAAPAVPAGTPTYSSVAVSSVRVTWTPSSGATSIALERATAATGPWTTVASLAPTALGYTSSGLAVNTLYWFRVRSTNTAGTVYSPASSVITLTTPPGAPTFSDVTPNAAMVSWIAPAAGATSYKVERATTSTGPWAQLAAGVTATSYADAGLVGNTAYYYRVRATNAEARDSAFSPVALLVTPGDPAVTLPIPTLMPTYGLVAATSVWVSWTGGSGETSHAVERGTSETGPWTLVASGLSAATSSYTSTGLAGNTLYWYRVRSTNAAGAVASAASSIRTVPRAPGAPTFTNVSETTVTVTWTAPLDGAASYDVERSTASTGPWARVAGGLTTTTHTDTSGSPATTYYYRVNGRNADGFAGSSSSVRSITTLGAVAVN